MKTQVLVVNDHPSIAPLFAGAGDEFLISQAQTGAAALDLLRQPDPWAVVLAAVQLPDMDTFDFFRQAATLCQAIPVLLVADNILPQALHQANNASIFRVVPTSTPASVLNTIFMDAVQQWQHIEQGRHLREQILQLTTTDQLTGCANRVYGIQGLDRELNRSLRYGHALSVILCDIDGLRTINDAYGQHVGDQILKGFARHALLNLRHEIDTVTRWGEDEFLLVLPETPIRGAARVASRLCEGFAGLRTRIDGQQVDSTASFGVTAFSPGDPSRNAKVEDLLLISGRCLYQVKAAGGNQVLCCP